MTELRGSDLAQVSEQLGREPLADLTVVARCPVPGTAGDAGHPLVIRNHPVDRRGDPFPTLYWLTCPEAVHAVARLEAQGWIRRLAEDPALADGIAAAHREYAADRGRFQPGAEAWGGVGGSRSGVKCLHAHYAHHLAGGSDPVGAWVAERVEPVHLQPKAAEGGEPVEVGRSGRPVAAVDMGTNSIRLLVAVPRPGGDLLELARDMVITRLGQGVDRSRQLDPEALRRTVGVLERYVRRARALGAERIRVAATSAVRDAADRERLFRAVAALTGAPPEVLSGEEEAGLSFLGATRGLDRPGPFLVFDIGGGSTEVVLGSSEPEVVASADAGSVRITERVSPGDPPTERDLAEMRRLAEEALGGAAGSVPVGRARTLVGVAGTTTTVQAVALGLPRYDPEAIHGSVLSRQAAERVAHRLAGMTTAERRALPVMAPGREDVIVAGCAILLEVMRRWGFEECVVSERDILDGLALEVAAGSRGPGERARPGSPDGPG